LKPSEPPPPKNKKYRKISATAAADGDIGLQLYM
jgi:hypothetical protein